MCTWYYNKENDWEITSSRRARWGKTVRNVTTHGTTSIFLSRSVARGEINIFHQNRDLFICKFLYFSIQIPGCMFVAFGFIVSEIIGHRCAQNILTLERGASPLAIEILCLYQGFYTKGNLRNCHRLKEKLNKTHRPLCNWLLEYKNIITSINK